MAAQQLNYEEVPLERLEHEISTLAAQIYAATCRWLRMIAAFDRREGWATWGMTCCAEWLAFKCSLSPRAARDHVRVARALDELPLITEAFGAGELSYSKVRALVRIAGPDTEQDLMAIARHCSAAQLEKLALHYRRASSSAEELAETNRRHRDRYVTWHYDDYGMLKVEAYLDPEEGAVVAEALEAAVQGTRMADRDDSVAEVPDGNGSAEPRPKLPKEIRAYADPDRSYIQRAADGLVMMADTYLQTGPVARKGGDRYEVMIHVDQRALHEKEDCEVTDAAAPRSRCHIEDGPSLAPETARRILCDCSIVELVEKDGQPLDVGRKTRKIPTAIRRALEARDKGCRWSGCNRKRFTDGHHIKHWTRDRGETKLDNLTLLCRVHHRMVHEGFDIVLERDGEVRVFRPDGIELPRVPFLMAPDDGIEERNAVLGVDVDHETCMTLEHEPMDHSDTVGALLHNESRARPEGAAMSAA